MANELIIHGATSDVSGNEVDIADVELLDNHSSFTMQITHINGFPAAEIETLEYLDNKFYSDVKLRLGFEIKGTFKTITSQIGTGKYPYSDTVATLKKPYLFLEFDGTYYDVVSNTATKCLSVALTDFSASYVSGGVSQLTLSFKAREVL